MGMTPVPIYDPTGGLVDLREKYILGEAGDRWKLRPIDMDEFQTIRAQVETGTYRYRVIEQEFRPAEYLSNPELYLKRLQAEAELC